MSQLADAERKACILFHLLDVRLLSKKNHNAYTSFNTVAAFVFTLSTWQNGVLEIPTVVETMSF